MVDPTNKSQSRRGETSEEKKGKLDDSLQKPQQSQGSLAGDSSQKLGKKMQSSEEERRQGDNESGGTMVDDLRLVPGLARRPRSRSETCITASYSETCITVGYSIGDADSSSKMLQDTTGSQSESSTKVHIPGSALHVLAAEEDRKTKEKEKPTRRRSGPPERCRQKKEIKEDFGGSRKNAGESRM